MSNDRLKRLDLYYSYIIDNENSVFIISCPVIYIIDFINGKFDISIINEIKSIIKNKKSIKEIEYNLEENSILCYLDINEILNINNSNFKECIHSIEINTSLYKDPISEILKSILSEQLSFLDMDFSFINNFKLEKVEVSKPQTINTQKEIENNINSNDDVKNDNYHYIDDISYSANAIKIIKRFESFNKYPDKDTNNKWIIGYGYTITNDEYNNYKNTGITVEDATTLVINKCNSLYKQLKTIIKVKITQNQLDALISLAYNIGFYKLKGYTLIKKINEKKYNEAAEEFLNIIKDRNGKKLNGLINRRKIENKLFKS